MGILACLGAQHDPALTATAFGVCGVACGAATLLVSKTSRRSAAGQWIWPILAGLVFGVGTWATHFVAMLAFHPGGQTGYDPGLTLASLGVAVVASQLALSLAATRFAKRRWVAGALLGAGVAAMHYIGMLGYLVAATLTWNLGFVALSIGAGVVLAAAGIDLIFRRSVRLRVLGGVLLALCVACTHFVGMAALNLSPDPTQVVPASALSTSAMVALSVAAAVLLVATAVAGALADTETRLRMRRRLKETVGAMPNAVAIFDRGGRLVVWNDSFARICEESTGHDPALGDLASDIALASLRGVDRRVVQDLPRSVVQRPAIVETHGGRWLQVSGRATAEGGMVATWTDISDLKHAEQAMAEARAAAEVALQAKSEFLANMSHELRTPLTSIIGYTRLMSQQQPTGQLAQFVERVSDAGHALMCAVNDILDFSKLEAGQVTFNLAPTPAQELLRRTLDFFVPQAAAKDLELSFEVIGFEDDLVLMLDSDRMRQVLINLVSNAVKFTEAGQVGLRARYDAEARRLRVEVIDTGPGISTTDQERLFRRFSQIDGSLTRTGGTGLGLAICKGIIEGIAGAIGVDSTPGRGSNFWIEVPAPAGVAVAICDGDDGEQDLDLDGLRVLVVDDHAANRELAVLYLGSAGVQVTVAEDGKAAVQRAEDAAFDVILMDLNMPGMDGAAAVAAIRSGALVNARTPVLAYTAEADQGRLEALGAAGFVGVVEKPVDPTLLLQAVAKAGAYDLGSPVRTAAE